MNNIPLPKMGLLTSFSIFGSAALLLYLQTHFIIPYLVKITGQESILFWFIVSALGVFLPLLVTAFAIVRKEGYKINSATWRDRMRFRKMTGRDWAWSIGGAVTAMVLSGAAVFGMKAIFGNFSASPSFMAFTPFNETGKYWMFLIWAPYWILNIMGEEILWRGAMQPRMESAFGKYTWVVTSIGWTLFHLPFGLKMLPVMLPLLIVIPFVMQQAKNSWNGVVMHALVNGPSFIAIALGLV